MGKVHFKNHVFHIYRKGKTKHERFFQRGMRGKIEGKYNTNLELQINTNRMHQRMKFLLFLITIVVKSYPTCK